MGSLLRISQFHRFECCGKWENCGDIFEIVIYYSLKIHAANLVSFATILKSFKIFMEIDFLDMSCFSIIFS